MSNRDLLRFLSKPAKWVYTNIMAACIHDPNICCWTSIMPRYYPSKKKWNWTGKGLCTWGHSRLHAFLWFTFFLYMYLYYIRLGPDNTSYDTTSHTNFPLVSIADNSRLLDFDTQARYRILTVRDAHTTQHSTASRLLREFVPSTSLTGLDR